MGLGARLPDRDAVKPPASFAVDLKIQNDSIVLAFSGAVAWIAFEPDGADRVADELKEKAAQLRIQRLFATKRQEPL